MNELQVESTRGDLIESVHRISAAVVTLDGRLVARAGDPELVTFWRSAAKPFQAWPCVADGAADQFGLADDALALACASHSSERVHLEVAERMLRQIGVTESALACAPHPPLGKAEAALAARTRLTLTPIWSNCSGKHAAMLALAKGSGWELTGYERLEHPVQQRILESVAHWTGLPISHIKTAVDGCAAVCYALPLSGMARAYAALGASSDEALRRLREAMMAHPNLVAGAGRYCTQLMAAVPGEVVTKIGAEGIYCAALPALQLGIALKVEDGDMNAAAVALSAVLTQCFERAHHPVAIPPAEARPDATIRNTRGMVTGVLRATGRLQFLE